MLDFDDDDDDDDTKVPHSFEHESGFQTASGKSIDTTEDAQSHAQTLLHSENNDTNFGNDEAKICVESNVPDFDSKNAFQTASGKNVSVSVKSLQNVSKLFIEEPSFLPVSKTNNLFQTASGKSVNVSAKSLQLVSEFFNEEHSKPNSHTYGKNVSVSAKSGKCLNEDATLTSDSEMNNLFQTASGKNVTVSAKSVESVRGVFNEKPLLQSNCKMDNLFQTASGKNVSVSAKSLQSVSNIFVEDATERDSITNNLFKTASGKKVNVSAKSLQSVSNIFIEDASLEQDSKTNNLFQTASGKNVNVSAKSLQNVSHIFNEESKTKNLFQTASGKNVSVSAKSAEDVLNIFDKESSLVPNSKTNSFFQTASGKNVGVSVMSVENVLNIFDKESSLVPDSKTSSLFQTASGENVNVSAKSVQDVSDIFHDQPHLMPCSKRNNLFQTASGKNVTVSSKSLQNVSHILEESSSLVPNLESIQKLVANSFVESCRRESTTLQTPGLRNGDSLKENDEKLQTTPVSRYNHNNSRKSLDLVSNDERRPVYSRPEQRYFDRRQTDGRHFLPLEAKTLQQSKASYEDQLESLLVPQRQQDKSKFITPYKKTTPSSTVSSTETQNHKINKSNPFIAKRCLKLATSTKTKAEWLMENSLETENSSISDSVIATKNDDTNISRDDFMCHIEAARMQQDKIIRCKKKQKIRPLPGQLSCMKGERSESKIHYEHLSRQNLNRRELIKQGCLQSTLGIRSTSAEDHRFNLTDFYPNLNTDILVGDGAKLVADNQGFAGKEEFYRSFLTMEGVDINLITEEWLYNHYRWILWKLAAYEVTLSSHFAGRCLTPNNVMLQLKYRYDKEIDQCQRSAIKKIVERDDTACKRMVLCICDIKKSVTDTSVQLTDSWYSIWACLDIPLLDLINKQKLVIGQKIVVSGAELVGSQDACSPLDIPESLKLKLCYNSTRPASWCSKLGFQSDPRPLCVPLSTLHSDGGNIGSIDVIVSRVYPMMYMEKMPDGGCVFRTSDMEEKESRHHECRKQELMEKMYSKLEKQLESSEQNNMCRRKSNKRWKKSEIEELTNGQDILEAVENSLQPEEIHSWLSNHQIDEMRDYQQQQHDDKQRRLQQEIQQSLSDNQQSTLERKVTPLLKIRLIGCGRKDIDNKAATILTVWRPSPEWCQLQESKRYKLYNLQASFSKSRLESLPVHVTSTRQSRIQHLHIDENLLDVIYDPREVWRIKDLKARQPAFKEFDFVGLVFDVENGRQGTMQIVHCVDFDGGFLNITFWNGLKNFGVKDILVVGKCFVACNLILKSHYGSNIIQADVLQEVTQISQSSKLPLHRKYLEKFTTLKQEEKIAILENSIKRYQDRHMKKTVAKTPEKMYSDLPVDLEQFFSPMTEGDTSFENQDDVSQKDVELSKRKALIRKKTSKLLAYGSPSPLSLLNCSISPAAAKAFRVPIIKKEN
ncbi:breast cancer type 2 susceptibility protein [Patella vulgata]|uniref:breast cancer type 2 susceptibility protein n=1 Tax=Patella vulgata TaxID=6465 RepID=UPI0024A8B117|nr:breast cancer type 2 susceptibility protein [Patella vulgata]